MAGNMRALLEAEGPGSKGLLWAHNGHVKRAKDYDFAMGHFEVPTMGSFLQGMFGAEYVPIGFAFNQGSFQAWANAGDDYLSSHVVGPATEGMVDAVLAATGLPLFALDLARVPADGPVARWMASKPYQRMIGAGFALEREHRIDVAADPRDNFDVLLFVETTNAARGNRRGAPGNTAPAANQQPTNVMLAGAGPVPDGWRAMEASYFLAPVFPYATAIAEEASPSGGRAVQTARTQAPIAWGDGALGQSFPAAPWRGRRFIFSAAVRAEAVRIGTGAQMFVAVVRAQKDAPLMMALASDTPVRSLKWSRRSVAIDVPADAERIVIGLAVIGNAAGSFGDLVLETGGPAQASLGEPHSLGAHPSHGEHDLSEVTVGAHHGERVGHLSEWERLIDR
jgi:hypothetical protein